MEIQLYNAITNKKEIFKPEKFGLFRKPKVGMYHCGPTVYDFAHIGNLKAYIFADTLRRVFEYSGYSVKQVINITDIGHLSSNTDDGEDKMLKGLEREGLPRTIEGLQKLANIYETAFRNDIKDLNVKTNGTNFPRASKHIFEELNLIKKLDAKGFIYKTNDGIYFDTSKDSNYGKLGHLTPIDESSNRISSGEKRNARDFALWKFSKTGVKGFPSPYGEGFPGWHIECSAMSIKYLGETFDIHTGGVDHIPVHHNNEIAQSENATGKIFARFFMHNAFININDGKMAKSEGNSITLKTLKEKGFSPTAYRYFILGARYSTPINFTWEALESSKNALDKLKKQLSSYGDLTNKNFPTTDYEKKFEEIISNDLDTPNAIAMIWEMIKDQNLSIKTKRKLAKKFDSVLGLGLCDKEKKVKISKEVNNLFKERNIARNSKNWDKADILRLKLKELGFEVKDTPEGPKLEKL